MTEFDPVRIVEVLSRHEVEFVVIGGFAAELYQAPIPATQDIDITPRVSEENLARLSAALEELGARVRTAGVPEGLVFSHDGPSLGRATMWNLTTTAGDFDLTFRPSGTDGYEDLSANAVVADFAGHGVSVAALADVIRSKEAAGRPKDLSTLDTLRDWLEALEGSTPDDLRTGVLEVLDRRAVRAAATGMEGGVPPTSSFQGLDRVISSEQARTGDGGDVNPYDPGPRRQPER